MADRIAALMEGTVEEGFQRMTALVAQEPPLLRLQRKIEAVVWPWRQEQERSPPFTPVQLVVMAIVMNNGHATQLDIHSWLLFTFPVFTRMMAEAAWESTKADEDRRNTFAKSRARPLHRRIALVFTMFDLPLQICQCTDGTQGSPRFTITLAAAEELLSPAFPPFWCFLDVSAMPHYVQDVVFEPVKPTGIAPPTFNFFVLPSELRNTIFEMVFSYPKSGVEVHKARGNDVFGITSRDWNVDFSWDVQNAFAHRTWDDPSRLWTRPMSAIFDPLLVNKRFYAEAMPVFYRINHFHCADIETLTSMLTKMPMVRLQHVTQISFRLRSHTLTSQACATLASLPHLSTLDIDVDEYSWLGGGRANSKKRKDITNMPGINHLRSIRGLNAVIFRDSPTLQREIGPDMIKPKGWKKAAAKPKEKKRKQREEDPNVAVVKKARLMGA